MEGLFPLFFVEIYNLVTKDHLGNKYPKFYVRIYIFYSRGPYSFKPVYPNETCFVHCIDSKETQKSMKIDLVHFFLCMSN